MDPKPRLICLYSDSPQQGKTTVARHLEGEYGYTIVKFAAPLYAMLRALKIEACARGTETSFAKEEPIPELSGVTTRHMLQTLGTEWGRDMMHKDFWANITHSKVVNLLKAKRSVVVDDMRFPNEYDAMLGFDNLEMWYIHNAKASICGTTHQSEGQLDRRYFNRYINNHADIPALHRLVDWELDK